MNIFLVGLGLIGASYAQGLKKTEHKIFGYDQDETILKQAKQDGLIEKDSSLNDIKKADLVIIALYPKHIPLFLRQHRHLFNPKQTLTDVCGIKTWLLKEIETCLPANLHYTSHHPMAGKEISGYDAKDYTIFENANFIIVKTAQTRKDDILRLKQLATDLKFKDPSIMPAQKHDELIAYTSQLTHVIACSLTIGSNEENLNEATGNSYQDLTRIAKINADLWSELFLNNQGALLKAITDFKTALNTLETAIDNEDTTALKRLLNKAKKRRDAYD